MNNYKKKSEWMLFLQKYRGHKIYIHSNSYFHISYQHCDRIWKRNIKTIAACKHLITLAHSKLSHNRTSVELKHKLKRSTK